MFQVFDGLLYSGKPTLAGTTVMNQLNGLTLPPSDASGYYYFDYEPAVGTLAQVQAAVATAAPVLATARSIAPSAKLGFYSLGPVNDYYGIINPSVNEPPNTPLAARNSATESLNSACDYVSCSLYNDVGPRDPLWIDYAIGTVYEARRVSGGAPVYAFAWPQYNYGSNDYIDPYTWATQLEWIMQNCDGLILWGGYMQAWDASAPWWLVASQVLFDKVLLPGASMGYQPIIIENPLKSDLGDDPQNTKWKKINSNFAALYATTYPIAPSGDISGLTDYANLAALTAANGIIILAAGSYYFNAQLIFTGQVRIYGAGSSDGAPAYYAATGVSAATILLFGTITSSTINGITLEGNGSVIEGCHVQSASTTLATAGVGITLSGALGGQVNRCSTYGFYAGILNLNTAYFTNTYNKVVGPSTYGILCSAPLFTDNGECLIHGNFLIAQAVNAATPTAAICVTNGGGVKITGNKVNGYPQNIANANRWVNSILFKPGGGLDAGSTSSTGVFLVGDNSLESNYADGILFDGSAASTVSYATVSGLTTGVATTVTVNTVSGSNPFAPNAIVSFYGFTTTTQINGLQGTILSVGGSSGAWTFVCTINSSSGFTAFGAGTGSVNATATWQGFSIVNNEFGPANGSAVSIKGSGNINFNDILIEGNQCPYGILAYVNAYGFCNNVNIGSFVCEQILSAAIVIGQQQGVGQINSTVQNVTYDLSKIAQRIPRNSILLLDYTTGAEDQHLQGNQVITISREIPQCFAATSISSGTIAGGSCTLNFSSLTVAPTVGNTIIVSGATPSGLNGANQITASTPTSVTFVTGATGAVSAAGSFLVGVLGIYTQPYIAFRIKCFLSGSLEGYGGEITIAERACIPNASATITANTVGTDYDSSGGAKAAFGFNVATNGYLFVTLAQGALAGTENPSGTITFEIQGGMQEIYRY